jgi:hypothetical protein
VLQDVVADERVWPDRPKQLFLGDRFPSVLSQADQDLEHLWLQAHRGAIAGNSAQAGLDLPGSNSEATAIGQMAPPETTGL